MSAIVPLLLLNNAMLRNSGGGSAGRGDDEEVAIIAAGCAALVLVGTVAIGATEYSEHQMFDLGRTAPGVSWKLTHRDQQHIGTNVESVNHRVTTVTIFDPRTGEVLGAPTRDGQSAYEFAPSSTKSVKLAACVDGKWQFSPEARTLTAGTGSVKSGMHIENYDGTSISPTTIPQFSPDLCR